MAEEVKTDVIKQRLDALRGARFKVWLDLCAHCGLCAESCFFYLAHDKDPKYMPSYKVIKTLGEMYKKKGNVDRAFLEEAHEIVWGDCTCCRRCSMYCPFGIDMALMIAAARAICYSQGVVPEALKRTVANYWAEGNQMAMKKQDWIETCEWMAEETQAELPKLTIPMDKEGADMMYTVNVREPMFYPQDLAMAATIFHVAGVDWTMTSEGYDDTNLAMFAGDGKCAAHVTKLTYDAAKRLKAKQIGITE